MLAEAQAARGHEVTVIVNALDARTRVEARNGVRVIYAARLATIASTPISLALPRLLARETPDIAHLHFPYPWGEAANYFFGKARWTIITYQSDIIRQKLTRALYAPLMHRVLARADRIIATSPNYARTSPVLARLADKCVVVPLAASPLTPQPPLPSPDKVQSGEGTGVRRAGEWGEVLFVGHLRYYKGVDYLLRALVELPRAHLTIVGTGPMERAWRALAHELRVADRVEFVGEVADAELPAYYAACDIFVLPSSERSEAFGVVQLEAMAAGKPVVCTEIGTGTSFVNRDGETGFVVPARDARALASAIARLMEDRELREKMGTRGRARAIQEFTVERMVKGVMGVYESLLQSEGAVTFSP